MQLAEETLTSLRRLRPERVLPSATTRRRSSIGSKADGLETSPPVHDHEEGKSAGPLLMEASRRRSTLIARAQVRLDQLRLRELLALVLAPGELALLGRRQQRPWPAARTYSFSRRGVQKLGHTL